ncbi:uncharacterized protein M6B38_327115 [Iris pallida]|uniref:Uncharacterized protein n=1 Tax=Iris pallida TaxID=29817 RepID=A0AAX6H5J7_IRIPA|nr:uncharacterized protein M6B38_327115 [Iris pallida]
MYNYRYTNLPIHPPNPPLPIDIPPRDPSHQHQQKQPPVIIPQSIPLSPSLPSPPPSPTITANNSHQLSN